jgi:enediyne biosynthesis protein E4
MPWRVFLRPQAPWVSSDINGDGFPDLFIGARAEPWAYGKIPTSHLLINDGTGKFTDVTDAWHPDLAQVGHD